MEYRAATPADEPFLREMLWLAYNWRDQTVPSDHWPDPDGPRRYVEGFGRPGDGGVIAEAGGEPAGAAWYRLLQAADAGYGYVADDVPELTIGVAGAHRGHCAARHGLRTRDVDRVVAGVVGAAGEWFAENTKAPVGIDLRRLPSGDRGHRTRLPCEVVERATEGPVVNVEIWSDIACPWCAVGKRRFEKALAGFEHRDDVAVTFRAFELDPAAPAVREGSTAEHLAAKYGTSLEQALAMNERMTETAAQDGLTFRFDIARGGSTFDAHRLLHLAAAHGRQHEVKERLMRAYLGEGELMSDHAALTRLAIEAGLPEDEVRDTLATDRFAAEVREDEATARGLGISAVPFFVIDRRFGLAGAQPPEVLGEGLRRAWEARTPLSVVAEGDVCGPDGC